MITLIIIAITGLFAYLFNEFAEASIKNEWKFNGSFWNSKLSWTRKYSKGLVPYQKKWYYFGYKPAYKERFAFSSTILVFLTDGEHLFQLLIKCIIIAGFVVIDWKLGIAYLCGSLIGGVIKELFIKQIN